MSGINARRSSRAWWLAAALAALAALAFASLSPGALGASSGQRAAAKDPITVMVSAPINAQTLTNYPQFFEVAKVYQKYINAKGGIAGHQLRILFCDDMTEASATSGCARKAIDQKVVACVTCFSGGLGDVALPIYEAGNTAWFGDCCAVSPRQNSSKISFPLNSALVVIAGASVRAGKTCNKPGSVIVDNASYNFLKGAIDAGLATQGKSTTVAVRLPSSPATDYSPQAALATSGGVDCLVIIAGDSNIASFLPALKATGAKPRLFFYQGTVPDTLIQRFPDVLNNAVVSNGFLDDDAPQWALFKSLLKKYKAKDLDYSGGSGIGAWTGWTMFQKVVEKTPSLANAKTITNQMFLDAASNSTKVVSGLVPPINFKSEWNRRGLNRIFNRTVAYSVIKNGKVVPLDTKYYDVSNAFPK